MRKKIGIIYGGKSDEHDISIRSAKSILTNLDNKLFEPVCIGISKKGKWIYTKNIIETDLSSTSSNNQNIHFSLVSDQATWYYGDKIGNEKTLFQLKIDIIFPVLHGQYGEDGRIQGMFHLLNIPFVGVDVVGASLSMNKFLTKMLLNAEDLPIVPFTYTSKKDYNKNTIREETYKLGFPCIVKPVNLGSSVGVTKINNPKELIPAVEKAFDFDSEVLIEKFVDGVEIEIAVLEVDGIPQATPPGKIVLSEKYEFYDFTSKYEDENAIQVELPAKLGGDTIEKMKKIALQTYKIIKGKHFIRIDMFLDKKNNIYVNEVNPIPGFTNVSMFPSLCAQLGYDFKSLITHIINQV